MKLVSAIVTTCKRDPEIVLRAIDSILAQIYPSIEIIVVDDSPETFEYRNEVMQRVVSRSPEIVYLQNETQSGADYSRNRGVAAANGDYVAFLDDDDEWIPEKIDKQIKVLDTSDLNTAMVYCDYYRYDDQIQTQQVVKLRKSSGTVLNDLMQCGNFCGGLSMPLLKMSALRAVGGFDNSLSALQDYDVWIRLAQNYSFIYLDEPLVVYHCTGGNHISNNMKAKISSAKNILEKYKEYYDLNRRAKAHMMENLTTYYAAEGDMHMALSSMCKIVALTPLNIKMNLRTILMLIRQFNRYMRREMSIFL